VTNLKNLPVAKIEPDPDNPRERFPDDELARLSESIDQVGVLVPVVVYEHGDHYRLLDGERRWRCSKELGVEKIPAVIVPKPSEENRLKQMFNIHLVREPWQDIPTAHALKKLMDETGVTGPSDLAQMTGLSTDQINRYRFALDLTGEVRKKVESGEVPLNYFYEVYNAVVRPLEKQRPALFAKFGAKEILKQFLAKRLSGAVPDIVSVRDAKYIIRKAAEDDPENQNPGPLDETLRELLSDEDLSVTEAYEDTVMVSVEADKLQKRADGMVSAFKRLMDRAADDEQRQHVKDVGKKLISDLRAVISA
jgi:ParB family transcriptional regulator, chromosome partitioning protein